MLGNLQIRQDYWRNWKRERQITLPKKFYEHLGKIVQTRVLEPAAATADGNCYRVDGGMGQMFITSGALTDAMRWGDLYEPTNEWSNVPGSGEATNCHGARICHPEWVVVTPVHEHNGLSLQWVSSVDNSFNVGGSATANLDFADPTSTAVKLDGFMEKKSSGGDTICKIEARVVALQVSLDPRCYKGKEIPEGSILIKRVNVGFSLLYRHQGAQHGQNTHNANVGIFGGPSEESSAIEGGVKFKYNKESSGGNVHFNKPYRSGGASTSIFKKMMQRKAPTLKEVASSALAWVSMSQKPHSTEMGEFWVALSFDINEASANEIKSNRSSVESNRPSMEPNRSSMKWNRPSMKSNRPSMKSNCPSMKSNRPSMKLNRSSVESNRPSVEPNRPSTIEESGLERPRKAPENAREDISSMSVKQLKAMISSAGLSSDDCTEKSDLQARAREAQELLMARNAFEPWDKCLSELQSWPNPKYEHVQEQFTWKRIDHGRGFTSYAFDGQTERLGILVTTNAGRPIADCFNWIGEDYSEKKLSILKSNSERIFSQENEVVSSWMAAEVGTGGQHQQGREELYNSTLSERWGLVEDQSTGTSTHTIQGVDYTEDNLDETAFYRAWLVRNARVCHKQNCQFIPTSRMDCTLVFVAGPNARYKGDHEKSSFTRTNSAKARGDYDFFCKCVKSALRAGLDAMISDGCERALLPVISGGANAGPHGDSGYLLEEDCKDLYTEVLNETVGGKERKKYFKSVLALDL